MDAFSRADAQHFNNVLALQTRLRYYLVVQPNNKITNQVDTPQRTFIEQARRAQIINAAIEVLAEFGYVNTSFTRIAKQAGISPSLISYHFKNKEELTAKVLESISEDRRSYVQKQIAHQTSALDKLRITLEADLANMGTHPHRFQAMVEVLFGMRGVKGSMVYLGDHDDPALVIVQDILELGQKNGEFKNFDVKSMAIIIDGARDTFLAQLALRPGFNLEVFSKTLITFALQAVVKENHV